MIETLKNSTIVWAIMSICTLIAIPAFVFAIISTIKAKRIKEFSYDIVKYKIYKLGNSNIKNVQLLCNGHIVNELTFMKLALWNSGNEVIRQVDIAKDADLCIKSKGNTNILDASIITTTDETNQIRIVHVDEKTVRFDLDYMSAQEGFVVQILHDGVDDDITVECKIKGGRKVRNVSSQPQQERLFSLYKFAGGNQKKMVKIMLAVTIIYVVILIAILILDIIGVIPRGIINSTDKRKNTVLELSVIILFSLATIPELIHMAIGFFHLKVPSPLRSYLDIDGIKK